MRIEAGKMANASKSAVDLLGETLKQAPVSEASLIALDTFRLTFQAAIAHVRQSLNEHAGVQCTLRPSKSTPSIISKLIRQPSSRLTQIQDIAGLRVIVKGYAEQNALRDTMQALYPDSKIYDRREKPSFGYRAVHLVIKVENRLVELQIRTELQHIWAQIFEKLADTYGHQIKYEQTNLPFINSLVDFSKDIHFLQNKMVYASQFLVRNPSLKANEKNEINESIIGFQQELANSVLLLKKIAELYTK